MPCQALRTAQPGVSSCRVSQNCWFRMVPPLGVSSSEKNHRKVACQSCRAQRSPRKQGQVRLQCLLMLEQRAPARRPGTSSGQRTPVQSSSQRSLQRAPASQLCAARAQILLPGPQPTSVPGKGRCGFANEGDPSDPAPHQAGPRTQQMPISRGSDSKRPEAQHPGHVAGVLSRLPAPCQPRRPHRLRDGSTWVPAGVRSSGLEITRMLGLASPHRREQGNPCRACLFIHHQLIHLRPEVRTPGQ